MVVDVSSALIRLSIAGSVVCLRLYISSLVVLAYSRYTSSTRCLVVSNDVCRFSSAVFRWATSVDTLAMIPMSDALLRVFSLFNYVYRDATLASTYALLLTSLVVTGSLTIMVYVLPKSTSLVSGFFPLISSRLFLFLSNDNHDLLRSSIYV